MSRAATSRALASLFTIASCAADPYTASDYFRELGAAHCDKMHDCCSQAEYDDWWTQADGDRIDCVQTHSYPAERTPILDAIDAGRIEFDVVRAKACVDALRGHDCPSFQPALRYRETYCEDPFSGTIAAGEPCGTHAECETGFCAAALIPRESPRICRVTIPDGGACSVVDGAFCTPPSYCQDGICGLGEPAGGTCSSDAGCIDHWCEDNNRCRRVCNG
ncbi:MAG: hypothetical protein WKG01_31610 [Kofleriaceae bacterium]